MKRSRHTRRHMPAELVEKVLLNLPVKSLLQFSAVSKSWNRMILGAEFGRRYRGPEMMALRVNSQKALVCPLSSLSTDAATPFALPFTTAADSDVSCGELRCVEFENSLCLYNPSTRRYRKLPTPSIGDSITGSTKSVYVYGLGYDSVGDDYKIVKTHIKLNGESEVYSLNKDCWREVRDSRRRIYSCISGDDIRFITSKGASVSGVLHWLLCHCWSENNGAQCVSAFVILTFDVSTEEYGKLAAPPLPESFPRLICSTRKLDVCVLRGRLSVCMNHGGSFVVWARAMEEDCGGWNKDFEIDYRHTYPICYSYLRPLYFYDASGNLIKAATSSTNTRIFYTKIQDQDHGGCSTLVENKFGTNGCGVISYFTYVESLIQV